MTPVEVNQIRTIIDDVANALQVLTLLVDHHEIATNNAAQDAVAITRNLKRGSLEAQVIQVLV